MELLEALYPTESWQGSSRAGQAIDQHSAMIAFYGNDRVQPKGFLLDKIDTGKVGYKAYGTAIRSV